MIQVQDAKSDAKLVLQILDQPQKPDGIRPARHGHADAVTSNDHMVTANGPKYSVMEFRFHARSVADQPMHLC